MSKSMKFSALAVVVAVGMLALPASAQVEEPATDRQTTIEDRWDRLCDRIPTAVDRVEQALARIQGDETVRGSVAWLEARAEMAMQRGRPDLAELLELTAEIRSERIGVLELRIQWLAKAAQICDGR